MNKRYITFNWTIMSERDVLYHLHDQHLNFQGWLQTSEMCFHLFSDRVCSFYSHYKRSLNFSLHHTNIFLALCFHQSATIFLHQLCSQAYYMDVLIIAFTMFSSSLYFITHLHDSYFLWWFMSSIYLFFLTCQSFLIQYFRLIVTNKGFLCFVQPEIQKKFRQFFHSQNKENIS